MQRIELPDFQTLWLKHVELYTRLFCIALHNLSKVEKLSINEDAISERLSLTLHEVCYEESKKTNCDIRTPEYELPIAPIEESELTGGNGAKRPDFTCKIINPDADTSIEHEVSLHVECKCLGKPTSKTWVLNENYITNGISRFDSLDHKYGHRATSGIMIGYILNMSFDSIAEQVNKFLLKYHSKFPVIKFSPKFNMVYMANHQINREYILPEHFQITHLWVELFNTTNHKN